MQCDPTRLGVKSAMIPAGVRQVIVLTQCCFAEALCPGRISALLLKTSHSFQHPLEGCKKQEIWRVH